MSANGSSVVRFVSEVPDALRSHATFTIMSSRLSVRNWGISLLSIKKVRLGIGMILLVQFFINKNQPYLYVS